MTFYWCHYEVSGVAPHSRNKMADSVNCTLAGGIFAASERQSTMIGGIVPQFSVNEFDQTASCSDLSSNYWELNGVAP